jgi:hypothetical protein
MYDVILSGPITGHAGCRERFALAQVHVQQRMPGASVWNPAVLEEGREYRWYIRVCCLVILDEAGPGCTLVLLKGWNRSLGSVAEWALARCLGMRCVRIGEM